MAQPEPRARSSTRGLIEVTVAGILWGTGGLAVAFINSSTGMSGLVIGAHRMLIGALALLAFVILIGKARASLDALRARPWMTIAVGCGTAIYQLLYFVSVLAVGVSVSTMVSLGIAPMLLTAWESVRAKRFPTPRTLGVLVTALVGLVLLCLPSGAANGPDPLLGILAAVGSGTVYAVTTVGGRALAQHADPIPLTAATTAAGAVLLLPLLLLPAGVIAGPTVPHTAGPILWLVYLGVVTTALGYGLLYSGLRTTTGGAAVIATLLEPLTAAVLAAALLSERLAWWGIVGGVLILGAVVALHRIPPHDRDDIPPAPPP